MNIKIYTVKDTKIGFMQPFYAQNEQVAIRMFTNSANSKTSENSVNVNPEDKELWLLGEYNDQTGTITSEIKFVTKAIDVIKEG